MTRSFPAILLGAFCLIVFAACGGSEDDAEGTSPEIAGADDSYLTGAIKAGEPPSLGSDCARRELPGGLVQYYCLTSRRPDDCDDDRICCAGNYCWFPVPASPSAEVPSTGGQVSPANYLSDTARACRAFISAAQQR